VLRGIAAFAVLVFHMYRQYYDHLNGYHPILRNLGFWGVSIFFVLSGFCIHRPQAIRAERGQGGLALRPFALNRIFRIVPAYYFAIVVCLIAGCFRTTGDISPPLGAYDVFFHFIFAHNFYPLGWRTINGPFWTIALEAQFYLCYALAFKALDFSLKQLTLAFMAALVWYFFVSRFIAEANPWRIVAQEVFITTFWSWYLGALLAEWTVKKASFEKLKNFYGPRGRTLGFLFLAIALNFLVPVLNLRFHGSELNRWIMPYACAFLILTLVMLELAPTETKQGRTPGFLAFHWLGTISYSLYLLHTVGLLAAVILFGGESLESQFFCIVFSLVLGAASYLLVEKPFMDLRKKIAA